MSDNAYSGQLSKRSIRTEMIELFERTDGYIEDKDNAWPRCICFDLGGKEGISLCYASAEDSLNSTNKANIRRVLSVLIEMDEAAWIWSDHESVCHYRPWLTKVLIAKDIVSLCYTAMAANTAWEVEYKIEHDGSWQSLY
ncbi:MAG: hypothetical protein AAGK66_03035 [Pseudomonadota bacterium]